jgi:hypothetical protein
MLVLKSRRVEKRGEQFAMKVQQSHSRTGEVLRVPGAWDFQISTQLGYEGLKVVSPTHRPPLIPRLYSWYSFLLEAKSILGPEGLSQWKLPMTPSGIEPATFRLVVQCLKRLRHCMPQFASRRKKCEDWIPWKEKTIFYILIFRIL